MILNLNIIIINQEVQTNQSNKNLEMHTMDKNSNFHLTDNYVTSFLLSYTCVFD